MTKSREQLRFISDKYKVVEPICIEVAASRDSSGTIYCASVVNLQNELIFGIGTSRTCAKNMLRKLLAEYYEALMSSDLNRLEAEYLADRRKLQRSIHECTT
jgi:hypothetical protein